MKTHASSRGPAVSRDACRPAKPRASAGIARAFASVLVMTATEAHAQDALRGAQLYLQLPTAASCVSCHGPDPSQGRNNLLLAAGQPQGLQQALNTVGAMGYLKPLLAEADVRDIAAYLAAVQQVAGANSPVALWPLTVEFGGVGLGSVTPVQTVVLRNLQATALSIEPVRLVGPAAASLALDTDCGVTLAPAAQCRIKLRAQPVSVGQAAAALVLASGTAAPWIVGAAFTARSEALGVLSTDLPQPLLDFGSQAAGVRVQRSFRLINHGTASATLGAMSFTGPQRMAYRIEAGAPGAEATCAVGQTLAPGEACPMRLGFAAGIAGEFQGTLQWRGDATQPANVALRATVPAGPGTEPPVAMPGPAPNAPAGDASPGGGCSAGPAVRRIDPSLMVMLLAGGFACGFRRRTASVVPAMRVGGHVTVLSPRRHGVFTGPAYRS